MVAPDGVRQFFYVGPDSSPVTEDDIMLFVSRDTKAIEERFRHVEFLPSYYADAQKELALYRARGVVNPHESARLLDFMNSDDFKFRANDPQNRRNSYKTAEMFIGLAFELFDLLQNKEEHAIDSETLDRFGVTREHKNAVFVDGGAVRRVEGGTITNRFTFEIPSCDYLQFVADGCERVRRRPIYANCYLDPLGDEAENSPLIGWVASRNGARLTVTIAHDANLRGAETFTLNYLLKFLLDLHLSDAQMVTYGIGEYTIVATNALTALWVKLQEGMAKGRAGVCRVCGRHFIAHDERKEKTRYCEPRCAQAFKRTRKVLSHINEGADGPEAAKAVSGISLKRTSEIALRNQHVLSQEFPNVDFAKLAAWKER